MIRPYLGLLLAVASCAPPPPILFEEASGPRVPGIEQTMYIPDTGFNSGLGVAIGDVDGDGRPDVYLAGGGIFMNRADPAGFRLEPLSMPAPPADFALIGGAFGDYDRDGDLDLALCGQGGVQLWENDGGHFQDVTARAGVAGGTKDVSLSVAWGDLDGDGYLDLAVANYGFPLRLNDAEASHLYLNRRDGSFAELSAPLQTLPVRAWVTTFADFDGDGRLDLQFGDDADIPFYSMPGAVRRDLVLLNRGLDASGKPVLVESSAALGLATAHASMGCAVGNSARGPGWDVLIADIRASWLYRSPAPGATYADTTGESGIDLKGPPEEEWWQWGSAFADLDGDGFEDILVAQSEIHPEQRGAKGAGPLLLRNRGERFALERYAFGAPMHARALVPVDLDLDGDEDVIVAPFFGRFRFMINTNPPRQALRLRLEATVSAPGAAGAVVIATTAEVVQKRMRVAGGQPHSSAGNILDIGLGEASSADLVVTWPSGAVQRIASAAAGERVISEPRFITISDRRPPADGSARVAVTIDVAAAGLGAAGTKVRWSGGGVSLDAVAGANGAVSFDLPPRATPGPVHASIAVEGRELPLHPALDYR